MLDFQKRKKKYFDLTLHDGTRLSLPTPTLKLMEELETIRQVDDLSLGETAALVKKVLETNKQSTEITDAQIQKFDFEDMFDLLMGYMEFTKEALSDPNLKSLIAQAKAMRD